jgi:serine/threonine protein kinase
MGVVVSAVHVALGQRVAVKFLIRNASQLPNATERFFREARYAVALQSEHITRILDVGVLDTGSPYMVMEHLSGMDFSQMLKLRRGQLSVADVVDLVLQASEGIAEAHTLGIVHRDLKLTNLFLTKRTDGSPLVKVIDFGLSKALETESGSIPDASLTSTNLIIGSPYYMSPEQIRSLKHVDARTDIWSLGVILYELITGLRPFTGATMPAVYISVLNEAPRPVRSLQPEVPATLESTIMGCLEKDLHRRVRSVAELAQSLAPFASSDGLVSVDRIAKISASVPGPRSSVPSIPATLRAAIPDPPTLPPGAWAPLVSAKATAEFLSWLQSFDNFVRTYKERLGLDEQSIAQVSGMRANVDDVMARVEQAKWVVAEMAKVSSRAERDLVEAEQRHVLARQALNSAHSDSQEVLHEVAAKVRQIAERLNEHYDISNAVRRQMGILAPGARSSNTTPLPFTAPPPPGFPGGASSRIPPPAPANLLVTPGPNRTNVLQWQGSSEPGTSYVIEAAVGKLYRGSPIDPETSAYKPIATVSAETTYRHTVASVPSGAKVKYRIRAGRGDLLGPYSAEVLVSCK